MSARRRSLLEFFAGRLAGSTVFGGFEGQTLHGIAGFKQEQGLKDRHKAMLVGMYVRPAARGTGLGRRLVEAVLDHARGRVELVQLAVVAGNDAALRLYLPPPASSNTAWSVTPSNTMAATGTKS